MKAKKAVKRLKKAQSFISNVVERYAGNETPLRDLLEGAGGSLAQAQALLRGKERATPSPRVTERLGKERSARSRPAKKEFSAAARKRLSVAAKKRWAAAKSRGANSLAG